MQMIRDRVAVLSVVAAALLVASAARAAECPPIWISQSSQTLLTPPDVNSPPNQTQLPDSLSQYGYVPAAAIHTVANANGVPIVNNTKAWCTDLTADPVADLAEVTNANVISKANGSLDDGSLVISEQSSVSGGGLAAQSSALVQIGFRDVLHAQAAGTELVPITLRRQVSGTWTLDEGNGGTLDRFILRSFTLTIWERTQTTFPQSWTRRLVIDDDDLNLLNGETTYPFEVLPGKDLILSLYVFGQGGCIGDTYYGDPAVLYHDCYAFMDFGDEFGQPITFAFEPGPGVTLTSDAGYTNYVPEPGADAEQQAAFAVLLTLGVAATRRSRG
jgi:hypothetical protein